MVDLNVMMTRRTPRTTTEKATFGAGCFWQVEEEFRELDGVIDTAVGYEGGHVDNPTYEQVCSGTTGPHRGRTDRVRPGEDLLRRDRREVLRDPRPHPDEPPGARRGYQYRSVIFAHSDEQAEIARKAIERAQQSYRDPIVTTIEPAAPFWRAEEYHQCYLQKRTERPGLLSSLLGH